MPDLETTIKGTKLAGKAAGVILPIAQREDLKYHVEKIIEDNPKIKKKIHQNPLYKDILYDLANEIYQTHGKYITGAKLIDSADRIMAVLGEAQEFFPGVGNVARASENGLELLPKAAYAAWYVKNTKDYKALLQFVAAEAASFIPYTGEFVDMANLYVNRARKNFRKKVADDFLEKVDKPKKKEWVN